MSAPASILSDSSYHAQGLFHGGNHRTAQLDELARRAGFTVDYVDRQRPTASWPEYWQGLKFLLRHASRLAPGNLATWRSWRMSHVYYQHALKAHSGPKLLIWEITLRSNWVAPHVARDEGFAVVAAPQNLESLFEAGSGAGKSGKAEKLIAQEIRHLAQADAVFCLSREDVSLLARHGVTAELLPYYPAGTLTAELLKVRVQRANSEKRGVLLLGTVHNLPTRLGMLELIDWLQRHPSPRGELVDIAGLGTEELSAALPPHGFTLHGTVSPERLRELLARTRAVVLLQRLNTGMLTRIPEMLVAGIPVLATPVTARNATHFQGVHLYDTPDELKALLEKDWPVPPVPPPPAEAEQRFVSSLKLLVGPHSSNRNNCEDSL